MNAAIMHMYHTAKVDIPKYFRAESSYFMSVMRKTAAQYINNRGDNFEAGNYPLSFPIQRQMRNIVYFVFKPEHIFPRSFLTIDR